MKESANRNRVEQTQNDKPKIDQRIARAVFIVQRNEITEHLVYNRLAKLCKDSHNAEILRVIGEEELSHAEYWKGKTGVDIKPDKFKAFRTVLMARIFGLTFTLKQMERNESTAQKTYASLLEYYPEVKKIKEDEEIHEKKLLDMLDEEKLKYVGSIVLGLGDALVELTGALAGFTLALGEAKIITIAGMVTGVSAAFSMASSDYLSKRSENNPNAVKSAMYTGGAYLFTVIFLILPFLLLNNPFISLAITLGVALLIIFLFTYYISVAKNLNFIQRFLEMALISLGVAALSFGIGYVLKMLLGIDA